MWKAIRRWAWRIKQDTVALYIASRDPRIPWYAKTIAIAVAAYALSPIDLIPDFIPVVGYLDDLVLLPLGVLLAVRLIPGELMLEFRRMAETVNPPSHWAASAIIIAAWAGGISAVLGWRWF